MDREELEVACLQLYDCLVDEIKANVGNEPAERTVKVLEYVAKSLGLDLPEEL